MPMLYIYHGCSIFYSIAGNGVSIYGHIFVSFISYKSCNYAVYTLSFLLYRILYMTVMRRDMIIFPGFITHFKILSIEWTYPGIITHPRIMSLAHYCKTVVSAVYQQWRYHSLVLSHWYGRWFCDYNAINILFLCQDWFRHWLVTFGCQAFTRNSDDF